MESTEKKICIRGVVFSTLAFAFVLALPASAGVKYWDNPDFKAFDVGDYVQDGLVANYDGIRNAGPDADHDPNAMTWVNCVDSAKWPLLWCSYIWNESTSKYEWKKSNTSEGEWASDGFVFDGLTYFAKWNDSNPVVLGPDFTYQFGTDGTISSQKQNTQYLIVPSSNWNYGGVGLRKAAGGGTTANSVYAVDLSINSSRPYFTAPGGELGYVNYIVDYSSTGKEYITDPATMPVKPKMLKSLPNTEERIPLPFTPKRILRPYACEMEGTSIGSIKITAKKPFPRIFVRESANDAAIARIIEITVAVKAVVTELISAGTNFDEEVSCSIPSFDILENIEIIGAAIVTAKKRETLIWIIIFDKFLLLIRSTPARILRANRSWRAGCRGRTCAHSHSREMSKCFRGCRAD